MKVVSFYGTVSASSTAVLASPLISHPYAVKRFMVSFALGCNNLVQISPFISPDGDTPSSGEPMGTNLLRAYGQVAYVAGNDERMELNHEVEMREGNSYLKVYANNTDSAEHTVNVQIEIEPIKRR